MNILFKLCYHIMYQRFLLLMPFFSPNLMKYTRLVSMSRMLKRKFLSELLSILLIKHCRLIMKF